MKKCICNENMFFSSSKVERPLFIAMTKRHERKGDTQFYEHQPLAQVRITALFTVKAGLRRPNIIELF